MPLNSVVDSETEVCVSTIRAVPTRYNGTLFASTLEADWAATFDAWGWDWRYEPEAYKLPSGQLYRADFHLPAQRCWAEVKGPHNERIGKPVELQNALGYDEWDWTNELVVVLRPPKSDGAMWEGTQGWQDLVIAKCPECDRYGFMAYDGLWSCRYHLRVQREPNKFWVAEGGALYWPGELEFTRAPRPGRRAA
jgi:hypothetical protein